MKRQIFRILAGLGIVFFLSSGEAIDLRADTAAEQVELTEEERYESKYYMPLDESESIDATGGTFDSSAFEKTIVEMLLNHTSKIDVSKYRLSSEEMKTYYFRVLYNHAELFYVDSAFTAWSAGSYITAIEPQYIMSASEADAALKQIDAAADEALELISSEMEDYEKALVIHDWLAVYCEYDYESYLASDILKESHTAYGAFVNKTAVCDGYSKAYQYIMQNKLGVPCIVVSSETISHAWNMIQIGGSYYHVDVTWDDPAWDCIGRVYHDNFLLSDTGITATGHRGWEEYVQALDTAFEGVLWENARGSIIYDNGNWYYINASAGNLVKTDNILSGSETVLYELGNSKWRADTQGTYYKGVFSYPQKYYNTIIFNGPKEIYSLNLNTDEVSSLYIPAETELPADTDSAVYNIYGLKTADDMLYYAIQKTPDLSESQSSYIKSTPVPGEELAGSVYIEGTARYGNILKANVSLETENSEAFTYQWYRGGIRISEAESDTYQITAEDIGKVLMVSVSQEGCIGSLTAKTAVVQKAVPAQPEALSVLSGTAGETLSSVGLPVYYTWAEPDIKMTESGQISYRAYYCPDSTLYEALEVTVSVNVSCIRHEWDAGVIVKNPACTETGEKFCTCIYCGETATIPVAATGHIHTEIRNIVRTSCTAGGYTGDTYCTDCGILLAAGSNMAASEHTWKPEGVVKEATATESGTISYICEVCGARKTVAVAAKGAPEKGTILTVGTMVYKVTKPGTSGGTVGFVKSTNTKVKSITVPASISVEGITYKVTSIEAKAFKNNKKLQKAVIGTNVERIGKEAFSGCKNLKSLTIKSKKLTSVGKNAVKNIKKNAVIHCPAKKVNAYKKLFAGKTGYKKTMKIAK